MNRDRFLNCAALAFATFCVYSMGWAAVQEHRTITIQARAIHACKGVLAPLAGMEMLLHPPKGTTSGRHPIALHSGTYHV